MKVRPIMGEAFRFMVGSASVPGQEHLVDWLEGACGCADWTCRQRKYRERTGKMYVCRHMQAAKDTVWQELIEDVKEQLLAK